MSIILFGNAQFSGYSTFQRADWTHHLFILWFICWSIRMVALLLCYYFTALCTSKGDISASPICYLWVIFLILHYIGSPSQVSLAALVAFCTTFISLCCNMLSGNDSEVLDCGHEQTLLWSSIFIMSHSLLWRYIVLLTVGVYSSNHSVILHWNQYDKEI